MYSLCDITRVCPKLEPHSSPDENENHDQNHVTDHVESQGALLPCKTETLDACTQRKLDCEAVAKENGSASEILLNPGALPGDQPIKSHSEFDRQLCTDFIDSAGTHGETAGREILTYQPRAIHQKNSHDTILSQDVVIQNAVLTRQEGIKDIGTQGKILPYHTPTEPAESVYQRGTQGTTLTNNTSTYAMGDVYNGDVQGTTQQRAIYQGITVHCNIFTNKTEEEYQRDTQGTTISYNTSFPPVRAVSHTGNQKTTLLGNTSPYKVAEPVYQGTILPYNISHDQAVVLSQGCTQEAKLPYRRCSDRHQELDNETAPPYDTQADRIVGIPLNDPQGTKSEDHLRKSYYENVPAHMSNGACCCSCHVTKFSTSHCPAFGQQNQRPSVIMVPIKWTSKDVPDSSDREEDEANEEKYFRKNIDGTTAKFKLSKEDWKRIPINTFPSGGRLLSGDWTRIFVNKVKESNPWCNLRFKNNHVRSENSRKIHSAVFFRGGAECKRPECNVKVRFVIRKEKGKYVDVTYVGDVCHSSQPGGSDVTNTNRKSKRVRKARNLRDEFLS